MKQQISPVAAGVAIVIVLVLLIFVWTRVSGGGTPRPASEMKNGVPASVAEEMQRRMGSVSGPQGAGANNATAPAPAGGK